MKLKNVCIFLFGLVLIGGALLACGSSDNTGSASASSSDTTSTSAPAAPTKAPAAQHFHVGQTVKVGSTWQIVVNSVKPYTGDTTYNPPKHGECLTVDVSLTNISSSEQAVSSIGLVHPAR